ncbi:PREDICTED: uncharacterized protein LOC102013434 [Chinchilla lanigera]|uniref:uncharacterized protein LOC102013434 n=1 Tax=Chinchilla lanigera TaxID=34839 RepID=UPI00038EDCDB|nr:PREDICTED: uncharacterized protein LOC102013434 [Chinchilla lanigera]
MKVDILTGDWLDTTQEEFWLQIFVVKTIVQGCPHHEVLTLPQDTGFMKQYRLPGGHEEIGQTILKLKGAGLICPAQSPFSSLVWPVWKPDGTWKMTMDHQEVNKMTPLLHAAVPNTADPTLSHPDTRVLKQVDTKIRMGLGDRLSLLIEAEVLGTFEANLQIAPDWSCSYFCKRAIPTMMSLKPGKERAEVLPLQKELIRKNPGKQNKSV